MTATRWRWVQVPAALTASVMLMCTEAMVAPVAAWAVTPPTIDPGALPADDTPGPSREMRQSLACSTPVVIGDPDVTQPAPGNMMLDLEQAWKFSTGNGVTVALIDTGVTPNPRFPHLYAGGDYVEGLANGGLTDCDSHGTIVASIIGAAPSSPDRRPAPMPAVAPDAAPPPEVVSNPAAPANPTPTPPPPPTPSTVTVTAPPPPPPSDDDDAPPPDTAPSSGTTGDQQPLVGGPPPTGPDGVVGVAPDARLISIRQSSRAFSVVRKANETDVVTKAGDILTLARAVRHAADLGARVINISVAACINPAVPVEQAALGAAIRYAAVDKDAVVVAAAGNKGESEGATGQDCGQNAAFNALNPDDPRDWGGVHTIVTPAWFSDYVLSVGIVTPEGQPMSDSIAGPWVGIAAPGYRTMGLANTNGAAVNALPGKDPGMGMGLWGTSFSAAYVSGVAALVRARFPELTAHQVIERITETAHHPARGVDNAVGAGVVDAVAALTFDVAPGDPLPVERISDHLVPAPAPAPPDRRPMITALIGAALVLVAAGLARGAAVLRRRMTT